MRSDVHTSHSNEREVDRLRTVAKGFVFALLLVAAIHGSVLAAEEPAAPSGAGLSLGAGLLGLAAALAVGLGAIGTAVAQARIGAAAAGAMAERPEIGGRLLIFLALPETMIILGFLVAFFLIGKIR